jgi:hypothetical protein
MSGKVFIFILALFGLSSCLITDQIRILQVEVMNPGIFDIPKDFSVAVINRDLIRSDTCTFYYYNGFRGQDTTIITISNRSLSDSCVNAVVNYFEDEGYFQKVTNSNDSLNNLFILPGKYNNLG